MRLNEHQGLSQIVSLLTLRRLGKGTPVVSLKFLVSPTAAPCIFDSASSATDISLTMLEFGFRVLPIIQWASVAEPLSALK